MTTTITAAKPFTWRTPAVILVCGCLIAMIAFGPRSALGFFLTPLSNANGWGREVFALSVAMQTLLYGAAQPFSGAIADRFGAIAGADANLQASARRGVRPPFLCSAGAWVLHLRLPARLRHRAPAGLSDRPRALGPGRRLDPRCHRAVQHHRLDALGLSRRAP